MHKSQGGREANLLRLDEQNYVEMKQSSFDGEVIFIKVMAVTLFNEPVYLDV